MDRKGIEIPTSVLLGILISIPILIVLFYTGSALLGIFVQETSEHAFDELTKNLIKLAAKNDREPEEFLLFVDEGDLLIGFSENTTALEGKNKPISRNRCQENGICLCLCKDNQDKDSCMRSGSKCEALQSYDKIDGVVIDQDSFSKNLDGLLVKGRTKIIVIMFKDQKTLFVKAND